jgi:hypothetical protein
LFAFLGQRQVVLSSPYPPAECAGRLAGATGRGSTWIASTLPLEGRVSPDLIRVARRQSKHSLTAWFSGRIEQAPDGRTLVAGTVGPNPAVRQVFRLISLGWLLIFGVMLAAGLSTLGSGHPQLPFILFPIGFAAVYALVLVVSPPIARYEIRGLLDELNTILDSTATFPGV